MNKIKKYFNLFLETLYPEVSCICCEKEIDTTNNVLCEECYKKLNIHNKNLCKFCGVNLEDNCKVCNDCKDTPYNFSRAYSLCDYNETSAKIIKDLKYNDKPYLARPVAKLMAKYFVKLNLKIDIVTFIPQTEAKTKTRGYNQAELIARRFCELLNLPCKPLIKRVKEVTNQASLTKEERQENLLGCFELLKNADIKNKTVLIIDDVLTTGSTLNEATLNLQKGKPKSVLAFTFARTKLIK